MAATATASPPIIPISNPSPLSAPAAVAGDATGAPVASPAFRQFLSRITETVRRSLSNCRPWGELVDRSAFTRPENLSDASSRMRKNLAYFRVNYAAVVAAALAISLLAHPFSLLLLLGLLSAWCFLYLFRATDSAPLTILGRTFTERETLLGLVVFSVFVVFLTSVGSLIISALTIGAALVAAHGAFRVPEDLFLDEPPSTGGPAAGLLAFIGSATSSAGAVAGRV